MKKLLTIFFISFLTSINYLGCQNNKNTQESKETMNVINTDLIKKVLTKQLNHGANQYFDEAGVEIPKKEFDNEELDACVKIVNDILKSNGYNKLTIEEFNFKIKKIFNRIIDINSSNKYLYVNYLNKCDKSFDKNPNNRLEHYGIYIIKEQKFITDFYYLPQILDYQKEYPEIAKIEHNLQLKYQDDEGDYYSIETWDMLSKNNDREYNLVNVRYNNIQTLVNRNKYLFNDNKASLAWLKSNDIYFLESLVKIFGYMNDKDLLKWVIDRTLSDKNNKGEDYNPLFFMKDCSNKFVFHKETFEVLKENINNKMLEALENYVYYREENKELQTLPFKQKAQVLAYVLYIGEYFAQQEKYSSRFMFKFMGTFYEFDKEGDKYDEEFKKNNYYNLSDFKKLWEQAKEEGDGIGLPM